MFSYKSINPNRVVLVYVFEFAINLLLDVRKIFFVHIMIPNQEYPLSMNDLSTSEWSCFVHVTK